MQASEYLKACQTGRAGDEQHIAPWKERSLHTCMNNEERNFRKNLSQSDQRNGGGKQRGEKKEKSRERVG